MSNTEFRNTTAFIIPFCFNNYMSFVNEAENDSGWDKCSREDLHVDYLLNYAAEIASDSSRFSEFVLNEDAMPEVYMYEDKLDYAKDAFIEQIRLSAFATGIGFAQVIVNYGAIDVDSIIDFAGRFKKSKPVGKENSLFNEVKKLIPSSGHLFFYSTADFKYDCLTFHMLKAENGENIEPNVFRLRRGYSSRFAYDVQDFQGGYDFKYQPYKGDYWSGSQEGLVSYSFETGEGSDWFLNNFKYRQLSKDYRFMYLMLLNQRFASILYIKQIAEAGNRNILKKLNKKIVDLKTAYSFRVISNDMIYQNVYSRMYKVLDIDVLLEDLKDNEEQMSIQYNEGVERLDRRTNTLLVSLAVLSIFSALIDAASYFELFPSFAGIARGLSLVSICAVILITIFVLSKKHGGNNNV